MQIPSTKCYAKTIGICSTIMRAKKEQGKPTDAALRDPHADDPIISFRFNDFPNWSGHPTGSAVDSVTLKPLWFTTTFKMPESPWCESKGPAHAVGRNDPALQAPSTLSGLGVGLLVPPVIPILLPIAVCMRWLSLISRLLHSPHVPGEVDKVTCTPIKTRRRETKVGNVYRFHDSIVSHGPTVFHKLGVKCKPLNTFRGVSEARSASYTHSWRMISRRKIRDISMN